MCSTILLIWFWFWWHQLMEETGVCISLAIDLSNAHEICPVKCLASICCNNRANTDTKMACHGFFWHKRGHCGLCWRTQAQFNFYHCIWSHHCHRIDTQLHQGNRNQCHCLWKLWTCLCSDSPSLLSRARRCQLRKHHTDWRMFKWHTHDILLEVTSYPPRDLILLPLFWSSNKKQYLFVLKWHITNGTTSNVSLRTKMSRHLVTICFQEAPLYFCVVNLRQITPVQANWSATN